MGPLGIQEMIFIFIFALIIFGPKKLPELGRTFGKGMAEFRRASNELKGTFQREMDNIERETRMEEARKAAQEAKAALSEATTYYDDEDDDYYDAYGESKTKAGGQPVASSKSVPAGTASTTESASSPGDSSDRAPSGDSASSGSETPSSDSSSNGVTTAKAADPSPAGHGAQADSAAGPQKETAAEKGAA
jgi:TatA/E family protein of Tat protein translocase